MSQPNVERHPLASNKIDFVFQFLGSQIYGHLVSIQILLICEFKIWRLAYFTLVSIIFGHLSRNQYQYRSQLINIQRISICLMERSITIVMFP